MVNTLNVSGSNLASTTLVKTITILLFYVNLIYSNGDFSSSEGAFIDFLYFTLLRVRLYHGGIPKTTFLENTKTVF